MLRILFITLSLILIPPYPTAYSCSEDGLSGIAPENDAYFPLGLRTSTGLSEAEFHDAITKVEKVYTPIIKSMGATLKINRLWGEPRANAFARQEGNIYHVEMWGGLARHPYMTLDGLSTVVCHEIGHHIGGAPKVTLFFGLWKRWASNEGQSDYFASAKCMRKVLESEDNIEYIKKLTIPPLVKSKCERNFISESAVATCIRIALAGKALAHVLEDLSQGGKGSPVKADFHTPDKRQVWRTNHNHPAAQCRLDTYFQGSICKIGHQVDPSSSDKTVGVCHDPAIHLDGRRPRCWFAP